MPPAAGLYGHIRNNNLKSALLIVGFLVLVALLWLAATLAIAAMGRGLAAIRLEIDMLHTPTEMEVYSLMIHDWLLSALTYSYLPFAAVTIWFAYAYLMHQTLISAATGAEPISRLTEFKLYNQVETLAIARGLPMPRVEIIETTALNAYASGFEPESATVAVTRGLLNNLSDSELEAVLAHEITHIINRDMRLMLIATLFAGALSYGSEMMRRQMSSKSALGRAVFGADLLIMFVAMAMAKIAGSFGVLTRLALSRSREYLADAGAVELTKDPDALISALLRIEGNDEIEGLPASMRAMMISSRPEGLFASHPSTESRIAALETFAGGRRGVAQAPERAEAPAPAIKVGRTIPKAVVPTEPRPFGRRVRPPQGARVS